MPKVKSCGAIVFRKDLEIEYLLLHYEAGHWDLVKGVVETGESEKETVLRELEEETGIVEAEFIGDFREQISYFFKRDRGTVYKEVVFFLVQTKRKKVELSYEHVGFEWLNYEKALEKLTHKTARDVLKKAHVFLKDLPNV